MTDIIILYGGVAIVAIVMLVMVVFAGGKDE